MQSSSSNVLQDQPRVEETEPLFPDWQLTIDSNAQWVAHYAINACTTAKLVVSTCKDNAWFKEYLSFESFVDATFVPKQFKVLGVGTVELPVQRGPDSDGILRLKDVLHIPNGYCNLVALPVANADGITLASSPDSEGNSKRRLVGPGNQTLAIIDRDRSAGFIKLSDPPVGPVVGPRDIKPHEYYDFDIKWSESERRRFEEDRASSVRRQQQQQQQQVST